MTVFGSELSDRWAVGLIDDDCIVIELSENVPSAGRPAPRLVHVRRGEKYHDEILIGCSHLFTEKIPNRRLRFIGG